MYLISQQISQLSDLRTMDEQTKQLTDKPSNQETKEPI
jgi:hypothetical protein